jgi:hypothetical protein
MRVALDLTPTRLLFLFWKRASLFLILGVMSLIGIYGLKMLIQSKKEVPYRVLIAVAKGNEILDTPLLCEILGVNAQQNLSFEQMRHRAYNYGIFTSLFLSSRSGGKLYCRYTLREPIYQLGNRAHTYMDLEGNSFPSAPFYSPKKLPRLYLSEREVFCLTEKEKSFLDQLRSSFLFSSLVSIDLSKIEEENLGVREIVLKTSQGSYLRLPTVNTLERIEKFENSYQEKKTSKVYDFRVPNKISTRVLGCPP